MKRLLLALLLFCSPAQAQIINTLPFQLQNGTTADATQVMADFNQIVANANANAAKNGANSDITSLTGLTTPLPPQYGGSSVYTGGTSTGSANAQAVATTPSGFTLVTGKRVVFIAGFTNTGAMTLAVNSTTATNVFQATPSGPIALIGGEIKAGNIVEAWFDGTQYQLITNNLAVVGALNNLASATTADLGTVPTHNVNITGAVTITSFGSSATTAYPIYYLTFQSTPTLTYNASSMILPGAADIVTATGDTAVAQYLGSGNWKIWSYQRAAGTSVLAATPLCGASGLTIANNAGTPNTNIDYSADSAVMVNSSGGSKYVTSLSGTINTTNTGVINGIQAARASSTWYDLYFLSNGSTTGGFAVAHGTALSAPSGYTFNCFVGNMLTDGSGNFLRSRQIGSKTQWTVTAGTNTAALPVLVLGASGAPGTPTWTATSWATGAPPTADELNMVLTVPGSAQAILAPNSSYGSVSSNINPPVCGASNAGGQIIILYCTLIPESSNVYYASVLSGSAAVLGWRNRVNAN